MGLGGVVALVLSNAALAADPAPLQRNLNEVVVETAEGLPGGRVATPVTGRVQVWVDLAMPAMAAVALPSPSMRSAYRHALEGQQSTLAEQMRALGGIELARVRLVRNAIAVELPTAAVDEVRKLPGVLRVRPVTHRFGIEPPPPTQ